LTFAAFIFYGGFIFASAPLVPRVSVVLI